MFFSVIVVIIEKDKWDFFFIFYVVRIEIILFYKVEFSYIKIN